MSKLLVKKYSRFIDCDFLFKHLTLHCYKTSTTLPGGEGSVMNSEGTVITFIIFTALL